MYDTNLVVYAKDRFPGIFMSFRNAAATLLVLAGSLCGADPSITNDMPMPPPECALLERQLLNANSKAADRFAAKYLDERGYLLHTMRWGTLDGPDDAIETFYNWTLLHALGGSDSVLKYYKKALEGHYKAVRRVAHEADEASGEWPHYKEFITQSDWFHTVEGMRGFMFLGLSDRNDQRLGERMKRFAAMYTGDRSGGADPVPGSFPLLHNRASRNKLLDLNAYYPKMLAHCAEYLDSVGDHPLNLASTNLGLNAFALTNEAKYKDWIVDYVGAWKKRFEECGGNIPTNVGRDGQPGGEYGGQWWKGQRLELYDLRRSVGGDCASEHLYGGIVARFGSDRLSGS